MPDDDLDSLDSMFAEALAAPPAQPEPSPSALSPSLRKKDESALWLTDGVRFVFLRIRCSGCGSSSCVPEGVYLHSTHARNHCEHLQRVNATDSSFSGLPRSVQYLDGESPFCEGCLDV